MNILNRKVSLPASISIVMAVAVFAVFGVVSAYQQESGGEAPQNVFESGSVNTINQNPLANENEPPDVTLGVGSPIVPYDFQQINGIRDHYRKSGLQTGTTTVCALQSPSATSTLEHMSINFETGSTTASLITIAKAANAFATTTPLGNQMNLGANLGVQIVASTTATQFINKDDIFNPLQWVVVSMAIDAGEAGVGDFSPTGQCQAVFHAISE